MRMTKAAALDIVLRHLSQDFAGTGRGIRQLPSPYDYERAQQAIRIVWKAVHKEQIDEDRLRQILQGW